MEPRKQQRDNKDRSNIIEKALGGAVAVGTTAFLLSKNGVPKKLNKTLNTMYRAKNFSQTPLGQKKWNKLDIRDLKKTVDTYDRTIRKAKNEIENGKTKIHYNQNSIVGDLAIYAKNMSGGNYSNAKKATIYAEHKKNLIANYNFFYGEDQKDPNHKRKFNYVFDKIAYNVNDIHGINKAIESTGLQGTDLAFIQKMHKEALSYHEKLISSTFKKMKDRQMLASEKMTEHLVELEELEKKYGTQYKPEDKNLSISKKISKFASDNILHKDKGVTIGDVLSNPNKFEDIVLSRGKEGPITLFDILNKLRRRAANKNEEERFLAINFDVSLRKSEDGEIYSTEAISELSKKALNNFANTIPGKITKAREFENRLKTPNMVFWAAGERNDVLAAKLHKIDNLDGTSDGTLKQNVYMVNGKYYRDNGYGEYKKVEEITGTHLISGESGSFHNEVDRITGNTRYKVSDNWFKRFFDYDQDRQDHKEEHIGDGLKSRLKNALNGNEEKRRRENLVYLSTEDVDTINYAASIEKDNSINETTAELSKIVGNVEEAHKLMHDTVYKMNQKTLDSIEEIAKKHGVKLEYSDLLQSTDEELLEKFVSNDVTVTGGRLASIQSRLQNSPDFRSYFEQRVSRGKVGVSSSIAETLKEGYINESVSPADIIRTELGKVALDRLDSSLKRKSNNTVSLLKELEALSLEQEEKVNAKRSFLLANMEKKTAYMAKTPQLTEDSSEEITPGSEVLLGKAAAFKKYLVDESGKPEVVEFRKEYKDVVNELTNPFGRYYEGADPYGNPQQSSTWITMNDNVGVSDIINSLNSWTKIKAAGKKLGTQLSAGRNDVENLSETTLTPFFMLTRLNEVGSIVGIGMSAQSMTSTAALAKNIVLKRALPAALALNAFEYTDDTSEDLTGKSMTGAFAEGVADIDIASRKVMDAVGITDWMKTEYDMNPIMQYLGDGGHFMNADELKDYYENGYTAVRKGAFWTFGSINEMRGGQIQYWQPTFVRRLQSDYYDKSVYGSNDEKWAHSWLPTPTHPLAPLRALMNPYWIEEMHSEDRPYALSGHLFEDGTPWGAVLNNTVGAIVKPVKELHPYRLRNGVDLNAMMENINDSIRQKARDFGNSNLIRVNSSGTPEVVNFNDYNAPTPDTNVLSEQIGENQIRVKEGTYGVYAPWTNNYEKTFGNDTVPGGISYSYSDRILAEKINNGEDYVENDYGRVSGIPLKDYDVSRRYNLPAGGEGMAGGQAGIIGGVSSGKSAPFGFLFGGRGGIPLTENQLEAGFTPFDNERGAAMLFNKEDDQIITENSKGQLGLYQESSMPKKVSSEMSLSDSMYYSAVKDGDIAGVKEAIGDLAKIYNPKNLIKGMNLKTIKRASLNQAQAGMSFDEDEGTLTADRLKNYSPSSGMGLLSDPTEVNDLINAGKGSDMIQEAAISARLISGIYGYGLGETTGFGVDDRKRIATSQDMTSFSRSFWDENMGGLGGSMMEITRRFIPDYRRNARISPLMNNMPDWMPDRFRFGDPYTLLPKGEMRLPGKGFESLNDLHPDQYGTYGAFDRYKILADIAPNTAEYKLWRDIAKKTVTDPELLSEMEDITERVNAQGHKHDFYEYGTLGNSLKYEKVVVSDILSNGKFKSGNRTYKLAGVKIKGNENENPEEVLGRYIHAGQEITIAYDENEYHGRNRDKTASIEANVFINGESINDKIIEEGDGTERKGGNRLVANAGKAGAMQTSIALASELIAHADVPWLSDQFMRVRSPLESYKAEFVYGTPYQTWSHPIDTFLIPAIGRAVHDRTALNSIGTALYNHFEENRAGVGILKNKSAQAAYLLTNRGAFVGAAVGMFAKPFGGKAMEAAKMGSLAAEIGHVATGGNSYLDEATSAADLGRSIAKFFRKDTKVGAAIGAVAGIAYRKFLGPKHDWVPEATKKKWEMDEYFDRLTYLKYQGLYHEAARRARDEEDFDVERFTDQNELNAKIKNTVAKKFSSVRKKIGLMQKEGGIFDTVDTLASKRLKELETEDTTLIQGGKWTRAALLYRKAAKATVAGMTSNSTWSEMVTALPTNDREYFMEFVKESDPDKRQDILNTVSPSLKKALSLAWGMNKNKEKNDAKRIKKENEQFFKNHVLPQADWVGWEPNVDLKNVQMKTIENEGMNLADFGFYESQLKDPKTIAAPALPHRNSMELAKVQKRLTQVLRGNGLKNVDVSVNPGPQGASITGTIMTYAGFGEQYKKVSEAMHF